MSHPNYPRVLMDAAELMRKDCRAGHKLPRCLAQAAATTTRTDVANAGYWQSVATIMEEAAGKIEKL